MALTSPGVEVTIIDQSQYLPAPTNSVPLILLATAQNKADASGTGVAAATTAANANKLFQVTSQRDLVNLYGTPFFYTTTNGTPIQGYELNEYGLLAAYSTLGVTNRCYVLRADIDLASLVGQTSRPTGNPDSGTYWLDTTTSTWGIYAFNQTTGRFSLQTPIVISNSTSLSGGVPLNSIGSIGDYAINSLQSTGSPTDASGQTYFYKTTNNAWVVVGSSGWRLDIPTIQGSNSNPELSAGDTFTINMSGLYYATITVPDDGGGVGSVQGVAGEINDLGWAGLSAEVRSGKLCMFSNQLLASGAATNGRLLVEDISGSALTDMGIDVVAGTGIGTYYQPIVAYGTSAQMPLWTSSQSAPRPTGSVWMKVGSAGNGLSPAVSVFNGATQSWTSKTVSLYVNDTSAIAGLDATGGQAIPAGTIYGQYSFGGSVPSAPLYLWERIATGPTVITGSDTNPAFNSGPYYMNVYVSVPGSSSFGSAYNFTLADNTDATDFITAWSNAAIPYTTATITTDGAIQLTHTEGGVILLDDAVNSSYVANGVSNGLIEAAGFVIGTTTGVKYGPDVTTAFAGVSGTNGAGGVGTGATFRVLASYGSYIINSTGVTASGSGYAVGDTVVISGASLGGVSGANNLTVMVTAVTSGAIDAVTYVSGTAATAYTTELSNWVEFTYTSNEGAPAVAPANSTNWFYSVVDQVDIMVNYNGEWYGYGNRDYDSTGFPLPSGTNVTDPNGPIISASTPSVQSDGTVLEYGDLWINTSDLENYPVISRWESVNGTDQWMLIDNTDQTSSSGVLFADARWSSSGAISPVDDPIPTITSLLDSNYIDLDAPNPSLYPSGMLMFNTRRSGYNVKQYTTNYFTSSNYPNAGTFDAGDPTNVDNLPEFSYTWVTVSGNQTNGAPYMGRKAQRAMVVQSLNAAIATNTAIRDEDNFFNLLATPNYPELQPGMITLNNDRGQTGYILGDTPMRLADSATDIQAWANNDAGAASTGEEGLVTRDTYMGLFYPSGLATDLSGNQVAVPASYMMLRTFLRNDTISYPWLAAAGTRRGTIDNALSIGYIDSTTGEFMPIKTRLGIRDVLYINFINPLVFFTGVGLLNYGNKTSFNSSSALDRTNVARLIAYIRRQLTLAARPFVFEPNDALTRNQIAGVVETLMVDLVAKRGLYDYLVVCDESNNTPARIDRNELWIDVAVEPVKAAEFIYIPVRILNTGELGGQ
jgi:hypothetical protein